jgi:hypothetical protein
MEWSQNPDLFQTHKIYPDLDDQIECAYSNGPTFLIIEPWVTYQVFAATWVDGELHP